MDGFEVVWRDLDSPNKLNYHWFDSPKNGSHLMTPDVTGKWASQLSHGPGNTLASAGICNSRWCFFLFGLST